MEVPPASFPTPVEAQLPLSDPPSTATPTPTQIHVEEPIQNPTPMQELIPEQACHDCTSQESTKDTDVTEKNTGALDNGTGQYEFGRLW